MAGRCYGTDENPQLQAAGDLRRSTAHDFMNQPTKLDANLLQHPEWLEPILALTE